MKKKVEIKKPSRRRWRALLMDSGLQFKHLNCHLSRKSLYWYETVSWGWGFGEATFWEIIFFLNLRLLIIMAYANFFKNSFYRNFFSKIKIIVECTWAIFSHDSLYFFSRLCCAGIVFVHCSLPSPPSENHGSSLRRENRMERRSWKLGVFGLNMARLHFYTVPMLHSMTTVLRHSLYVCPTYKKRKSLGCGIQTLMWGLFNSNIVSFLPLLE